jgi:hypothetical protein
MNSKLKLEKLSGRCATGGDSDTRLFAMLRRSCSFFLESTNGAGFFYRNGKSVQLRRNFIHDIGGLFHHENLNTWTAVTFTDGGPDDSGNSHQLDRMLLEDLLYCRCRHPSFLLIP